MKNVIIVIIAALIAALLAGCAPFKKVPEIIEPVIDGGRTDHSYNAPKEIKSVNIVEFSTNFFRYDEFEDDMSRFFNFTLKKDESGSCILTEERDGLSCTADESLFAKVQEIIKKYNLVKWNGTDEHTAGLPPEYSANLFRAVYDSGETLYFSTNNNPYDEWSEDMLNLFKKVFHENGITDYDPPEGTADIVRFDFEYIDEKSHRGFNELLVPFGEEAERTLEDVVTNGTNEDSCDTYISYTEFERGTETDDYETRALPSDEYYAEVSRLVQELELKKFSNYDHFPTGFDYNTTTGYYNFYIEFAYGNQLYGFSEDPAEVEAMRPAAEALCEYVKGYVEENK